MTDNDKTTTTQPVLRGWKQISAFVGFKDYRATKKHLVSLGLLRYENRRPRLSAELYIKTLAEADKPKGDGDAV